MDGDPKTPGVQKNVENGLYDETAQNKHLIQKVALAQGGDQAKKYPMKNGMLWQYSLDAQEWVKELFQPKSSEYKSVREQFEVENGQSAGIYFTAFLLFCDLIKNVFCDI